jgi:hypothetical protein
VVDVKNKSTNNGGVLSSSYARQLKSPKAQSRERNVTPDLIKTKPPKSTRN